MLQIRSWGSPLSLVQSVSSCRPPRALCTGHHFSVMQLLKVVLLLATFFALFSTPLAWRRRRRRRCSPRNCSVSGWSQWSSCSRSCGGGTQARTRYKTASEQCGGTCPYSMRESRSCNTQCCRVNCQWQWGPWSSCSGCGMSTQTRRVRVTRPPSCGGTACPTSPQTRRCNTGA